MNRDSAWDEIAYAAGRTVVGLVTGFTAVAIVAAVIYLIVFAMKGMSGLG